MKSSPEPTFTLIGVDSSPYTAKVRAVLRYRHIPHRWICRFPQLWEETAHVRPAIMPVMRFPNGEYRTDSTPLVFELEREFPGHRSVQPHDAALAFLSRLIEDMADEWLTKCLFHHRFATFEAGEFAARWVMEDSDNHANAEALEWAAREFRERQVGRMALVGATPQNVALIEDTYTRVLDIMESFVGHEQFLFGTRPSLADFGLYAQLRTIGIDPAGLAIMRRRAPRTEHWIRRLDDASGVDGEWAAEGELPAPVMALLQLAGDYYLPFLEANVAALSDGMACLEATMAGGHVFRAASFRYQAKCLTWLREAFAALPPDATQKLEEPLRATDCWDVLANAPVP